MTTLNEFFRLDTTVSSEESLVALLEHVLEELKHTVNEVQVEITLTASEYTPKTTSYDGGLSTPPYLPGH